MSEEGGEKKKTSNLQGCLTIIVLLVVVGVIGKMCSGSSGSSDNEWFFSDPTNCTTWTRDPGYAKSYVKNVTLRNDSTFTIESVVDGYGTVELSGKFSVDGEYDFYNDHITLFKDIESNGGLISKNGTYSRLLLKWDNDVSSFHVTGNPVLGMPYNLEKPGYCGSRNFRGFHDFLLVSLSEDREKVENIGVIYYGCQEGTGKRYNYGEWMKRK